MNGQLNIGTQAGVYMESETRNVSIPVAHAEDQYVRLSHETKPASLSIATFISY